MVKSVSRPMAKRKKKIEVDPEFLEEYLAIQERILREIAKTYEAIGRAKEVQRRLREIYAGS